MSKKSFFFFYYTEYPPPFPMSIKFETEYPQLYWSLFSVELASLPVFSFLLKRLFTSKWFSIFSWIKRRRRTWRGCGCEEKWRRCRRFARRIVRTGRRGGCSAPPAELRRGPRRRSGCRTRKGTRTRHRRLGSPWFTELTPKKRKSEHKVWVKNWTSSERRRGINKSCAGTLLVI